MNGNSFISSVTNSSKILKPIITGSRHVTTEISKNTTEIGHTVPYTEAADAALLRDKKTSDAIKANMSPFVKKMLNIKHWKDNLDKEINKPENAAIKEYYNEIKKHLNFSQFPKYSTKDLQQIIKNLRNRAQWLAVEDNRANFIKGNNGKNLKCFPYKGEEIPVVPVFNRYVFDKTNKIMDNMPKQDSPLQKQLNKYLTSYETIKTSIKTFQGELRDLEKNNELGEAEKEANKQKIQAKLDKMEQSRINLENKIQDTRNKINKKSGTQIDNQCNTFISTYNTLLSKVHNIEENKEKFEKIKDECLKNTPEPGQAYGHIQVTKNFKADEHKIDSLQTWYEKIEELENSNSYEDKIILNEIYNYINNSVEEDRKLLDDAQEKHIPNAYPKNIIPFFDNAIFEKALQMKGEQSIMSKYENCYKDHIIQKYSLVRDDNGNFKQNEGNYYLLDLNQRREDTYESYLRHLNELQFISPNSWCTHSFQGFMHGFAKHYFIILDENKKVKFGGDYTTERVGCAQTKLNRMESSTEDNNQKFSLAMVKQILNLLKSQNLEIPFKPEHSDLRYILAKAIIKEEGIDKLEEKYKAISTEFNLPALDKENFIFILGLNTKNYNESDNILISMEQFKFLKNALNIDGEINEFDEQKLKMINVKRLFESNYNANNTQNPLSLNDINNKLKELGYSSIDLTNEQERNETIDTIAKVVIDADLSKRHNIDLNKVSKILQKVGLLEEKQNEEFLKNANNILKNYCFYIENTINNIGSNRESSDKVKRSELKTKLENLGFISDLDYYILKYASNMYFEFNEEQNEIAQEGGNETIQEQNSPSDSDKEEDHFNINFNNFPDLKNDIPNLNGIELPQIPGMNPICDKEEDHFNINFDNFPDLKNDIPNLNGIELPQIPGMNPICDKEEDKFDNFPELKNDIPNLNDIELPKFPGMKPIN